ncbi:hypothetical protein PFISCL1PPCAC_11622, partial [Pristionchus fissidentatus]
SHSCRRLYTVEGGAGKNRFTIVYVRPVCKNSELCFGFMKGIHRYSLHGERAKTVLRNAIVDSLYLTHLKSQPAIHYLNVLATLSFRNLEARNWVNYPAESRREVSVVSLRRWTPTRYSISLRSFRRQM